MERRDRMTLGAKKFKINYSQMLACLPFFQRGGNSRLPTLYSLLPTPYSYSLLPTPYSLLPTPYSLLPTPYSQLPTPYSLLPTPYSLLPPPYSLLPLGVAGHKESINFLMF